MSGTLERLARLDCTLADAERPARRERLAALAARAVAEEESSEGFRLRFPLDPELAAEAAELAALEAQCCGLASRVEIDAAGLVLLLRR